MQRLDSRRVGEILIAVHIVIVDGNGTSQHQFEDISKEINFTILWFDRKIKTAIGVIGKFDFTIDVTPPHNTLLHLRLYGERNL